mgnify:CR=1 FL=1
MSEAGTYPSEILLLLCSEARYTLYWGNAIKGNASSCPGSAQAVLCLATSG